MKPPSAFAAGDVDADARSGPTGGQHHQRDEQPQRGRPGQRQDRGPFNDLIAIGALQRLRRRGVDVPAEVSVVGYDDIFGSDFCHPPLTTLTSPVEQAGRTLIDVLLGAHDPVRDPHPRQVRLPTQLRVRDSTGPIRTR
ncbi:LacI family DNA-binding transcriptional regulator [Pseudonocardia sp. H11422]|uniref:LacI family DNA-binding transcriptional regulator n=1 Tax=Pseudonocardia sp. H11422 TaxID=2835866 RepID=UPI0027E3290A|nr:LacI family DNA-binding transcriptional regulator [Pseudonocardia sp. H11422]